MAGGFYTKILWTSLASQIWALCLPLMPSLMSLMCCWWFDAILYHNYLFTTFLITNWFFKEIWGFLLSFWCLEMLEEILREKWSESESKSLSVLILTEIAHWPKIIHTTFERNKACEAFYSTGYGQASAVVWMRSLLLWNVKTVFTFLVLWNWLTVPWPQDDNFAFYRLCGC